MKKLNREPLSTSTMAFLDERTQQVRTAADPKREAQHLWKLQDKKAFEEVRATLESMATGRQRCMYCEDSAATDIEHFWPKSRFPERAFSWTNYLLARSGCNSNYKREQFPLDGSGVPLLIDPTVEEPREHLVLSVRTGKYRPRTIEGRESPKGEKSIEVFGLGRDILEKGRQDAWNTLPALLLRYDDLCSRRDWVRAIETQRTLCRFPFASVFVWFLDIASGPYAATFIDERCLSVLDKYPDIRGWL
ncbi:hypothetical protein [Vitiosangium sp. GDMCC 1.1324]|uniref:hypothetical protein n=1 Tax=Vitiosangium sp. (strain GDMCC 1.1324) TaxID=2138576 RepID=UPI000D39A09D|nr:hypothetical protein [Vitiosangium sp. GDMCC 1.1324]PTL84629.1 hypothetical protein DAT35_06060 [Vitiosangium sp. GDMCC 1.1324]